MSPNKDRLHEFKKRANTFLMPCPGELQIRLMGQVYGLTQVYHPPQEKKIFMPDH